MNLKILIAIFCFCLAGFMSNAKASSHGQENSTWAGSLFFRGFDPSTGEKLTQKKIEHFSENLKRNGIKYVYIFSGPYQKDGHLPAFAFSSIARESIIRIRKIYPELKILAWIGGVENKTVHLENDNWVTQSIQDTAKLMDSVPLDGVHIDLEYQLIKNNKKIVKSPLENYGVNWMRFHRQLRDTLPHAFISTAVVSTANGTHPWKHKHNISEIEGVSHWVNQIAFMFYDTNIHDSNSYRSSLRQQIEQIRDLKVELKEKSPQFLVGIGAFKNHGVLSHFRDPQFENVSFTLDSMNEIIKEIPRYRNIVDGIAVYCDWMVSLEEWQKIRARWINGSVN